MNWGKRKADFAIEFPLATSSSAWALLYGGMSLFGHPPSKSMATLPTGLQTTWGFVVCVAATVILVGLFLSGNLLTVARGMTLMAAGMLCYGVTIASVAGWQDGGQASGLTVAFALGLLARAYRLRLRMRHGLIREGD